MAIQSFIRPDSVVTTDVSLFNVSLTIQIFRIVPCYQGSVVIPERKFCHPHWRTNYEKDSTRPLHVESKHTVYLTYFLCHFALDYNFDNLPKESFTSIFSLHLRFLRQLMLHHAKTPTITPYRLNLLSLLCLGSVGVLFVWDFLVILTNYYLKDINKCLNRHF